MKLPDIQKQFAVGQTYTIYVNEKKPDYFVVNRKVTVTNVIGILVGILLLAGGVVYGFC